VGSRAEELFLNHKASPVIRSFTDPSRTKSPGIHEGEELVLPGGRSERRDLLIIRTDLKEELNYTMVIL